MSVWALGRRRVFFSSQSEKSESPFHSQEKNPKKLWEDPWTYAQQPLGSSFGPTEYKTEFVETKEDWKHVERLFPVRVIPDPPEHDSYPTPSGWQPPTEGNVDLPYYVRRRRDHLFPLYLECRRDQLNPKTMEFEYDELIVLKHVQGDVFACEEDLRDFLEARMGHPVATHVHELQGKIRIRHVQRADVEAFLYAKGL